MAVNRTDHPVNELAMTTEQFMQTNIGQHMNQGDVRALQSRKITKGRAMDP